MPWDVLRGATRLHRAIEAQAARGERALPLVPGWLATAFPELWDTEKAAKRWIEDSPEIKDLLRMINDLQNQKPRPSNKDLLLGKGGFYPTQVIDETQNGNDIMSLAIAEYRLRKQSRWSQALVWSADPRAALAHVLTIPERDLIVRRPNLKEQA